MPLYITRTGYAFAQRRLLRTSSISTVQDIDPKLRAELANLRIELTPDAVISGKIEDGDGFPVEGGRVEALRYREEDGERTLGSVGSASSNDLGEYRIFGLSAGPYYLRVSPGTAGLWDHRYVSQYFGGSLQPDDTHMVGAKAGQETGRTDIRLRKYEGVTLSGRLEYPKNRVAATRPQISRVFLQPEDELHSEESAYVPGSVFVIRHVPPGDYRLTSAGDSRRSPRAGDLVAEMPVHVGTEDMTGIVLTAHVAEPVDLAGSIVVEDGTPPPRMMVGARVLFGQRTVGHSDDNGSFVLKGLLPGHYTLEVNFDPTPENDTGPRPWSRIGLPISARLGETEVLKKGFDLDGSATGPLRITLPRLATIRGKLLDAAGQPSGEEMLNFVSQQPGGRHSVRVLANGMFELAVRPGEYHVYILSDQPVGDPLTDPDYFKAHENDFPPVHVVLGENPPIVLRRSSS
jgi:hypothetical protein